MIALFWWLLVPAWAADTTPPADLTDYFAEIRANHPAYLAAEQRRLAALAAVPTARALPDPMVSVGIFVEEVQTRVGPQKQRVGVRQGLPWPGKRGLAASAAAADAAALAARREQVARDLEHRFKQTYAEYYYLGRGLAITAEHLALLQELERVVTDRYETSAAHYNDLIRIQVEIEKLSDRLQQQQDAALPVRAALNTLLGRPVDGAFALPEALPPGTLPADVANADTRGLIQANNPELHALAAMHQAGRERLALADKQRLPDFNVGIDWINTGAAAMPNVHGSGVDPVMLSVGVNLPVWGKKNRAAVARARHQVEAIERQQVDTVSRRDAELQRALFRHRDATRKMDLFGERLVPKARESLEVITSDFQTGAGSYLDLVQAERDLLEFLLAFHEAEQLRYQALADIELILGDNGAAPTMAKE